MTTKMKKAELIEKVEAGLEEHKKQYEKALTGWMEQMQAAAEKVIQRVKDGSLKAFPHEFRDLMQIPSLHVDDYEAALQMLKANVEDEIVLGPEDFDQLVLGNWEWKERWVTSNSRYM
jgi:hypothetical protein